MCIEACQIGATTKCEHENEKCINSKCNHMKSRTTHPGVRLHNPPKLILLHLSFVRPLEISSPSVQTLLTIHIIKICRTLRWQRLYVPRDFHLLFLPTRHSRRGLVSSVLKAPDMSSHPELLQPEGLTTVSWLNACIMSESDASEEPV